MKKSVLSLVNLIEEKSKSDPVSRRIWSTAKIANNFARTIKSLRSQLEWSEETLAKNIGCSVDVIFNMENPTPKNIPKLEDMIAIAQALGGELNVDIKPVEISSTSKSSSTNALVEIMHDFALLRQQYLLNPSEHESLAVVSINSEGHVRLPEAIEVEVDSEAIFHSISMQVKIDER
ncbi:MULTISPECIES: helix-turn-helix domain-containing protein [Pseudomonas]|uniref:Helix-turn-helix transcriptional regulator n=1 Tax=Pseudomonas brassicacearum TaxID=930166 RepID=A0AAJ3FSZ2_9PSED|nr:MULTISPECIES: helix-turn-helix transcriptional regulator [Pseudomonas]NUT80076.1 helix-turn-helix transcriptional regulator [Pseudomonas brassicacearum]